MTEYICPNCRGGFPEMKQREWCPWCGQILGEYEPPTVHSVSKVKGESDNRESVGGPLYQQLLGWLE